MQNNTKGNAMTWVVTIVILAVIVLVAVWGYSSSQSPNTAGQSGLSITGSTQSTQSTEQSVPSSQSGQSAPAQTSPVSSVAGPSQPSATVVGGSVMSSGKNVIQNAEASSDLSTFVSLVQEAGLTAMLEGPGPFTLFIPDNEAFAKLPAGALANLMSSPDRQGLITFLQYHVVQGSYTAASLFNGEGLGTMAAKNISFSKSASATITINGTAVLQDGGIPSSNGDIFVIDTVLTPPGN